MLSNQPTSQQEEEQFIGLSKQFMLAMLAVCNEHIRNPDNIKKAAEFDMTLTKINLFIIFLTLAKNSIPALIELHMVYTTVLKLKWNNIPITPVNYQDFKSAQLICSEHVTLAKQYAQSREQDDSRNVPLSIILQQEDDFNKNWKQLDARLSSKFTVDTCKYCIHYKLYNNIFRSSFCKPRRESLICVFNRI